MITKQFIGKNLIELKSIDSTNNYLSNFANKSKLLNGTVILAHNQTKGKGQRGNGWESEEGKNLTFSIFLKTDCLPIDKSFLLSMATCNAIHKLVSSYVKNVKIKWPNDILIGANKICGILIENSIQGDKLGNSILGIGLNVNQEKFSPNSTITSLKLETKKEQNKSMLLDEIFSILEEQIELIQYKKFDELKEYYFNNLLGYNYDLRYVNAESNEEFNGKIIDVKDSGLIEIESNANEKFTFEMKGVKLINFSR